MKIKISEKQYAMLAKAVLESEESIFVAVKNDGNGKYILDATDDEICNIHECCADYLPIVGFDNNYNLNEQGKILESLIDKFHDNLEDST